MVPGLLPSLWRMEPMPISLQGFPQRLRPYQIAFGDPLTAALDMGQQSQEVMLVTEGKGHI